VSVRDTGPVEPIEEGRQCRVADVLVECRHRARFDVAREATPQNEVGVVFGEPVEQFGEFSEIVGRVGVAHDDVLAAGTLERVAVSVAVAPTVRCEDRRAVLSSYVRCGVSGAITDDDFRGDAEFTDGVVDGVETLLDALGLVHRREDDAERGDFLAVGIEERARSRRCVCRHPGGPMYWCFGV
jgi:hypothetical protein